MSCRCHWNYGAQRSRIVVSARADESPPPPWHPNRRWAEDRQQAFYSMHLMNITKIPQRYGFCLCHTYLWIIAPCFMSRTVLAEGLSVILACNVNSSPVFCGIFFGFQRSLLFERLYFAHLPFGCPKAGRGGGNVDPSVRSVRVRWWSLVDGRWTVRADRGSRWSQIWAVAKHPS